MAETFTLSELVIPGTFIRVQSEGLVGVGGISVGNVGLVGTVPLSPAPSLDTHVLSAYADAVTEYGDYDAFSAGENGLVRAAELLYANGARVVYARALPVGGDTDDPPDYTAAFRELLKDDVNILVAPQLSTIEALTVFGTITEEAENTGRDVIAVVGADGVDVPAIKAQVVENDRIVMVAPGIQAFDAAASDWVTLPATWSAAAVAGLISTLSPHVSPTNKVLPGVTRLAERFSYGETKDLVNAGVVVLERRGGVRVVRGVTTDQGGFKQITTRRIVDFAKAGIRKAANPFIGRLNNQRVRAALQGAIDGFLTTMVQDEALTSYRLEVTATRTDEINGRVLVNAFIQPVFSIDFVAVTMVLE